MGAGVKGATFAFNQAVIGSRGALLSTGRNVAVGFWRFWRGIFWESVANERFFRPVPGVFCKRFIIPLTEIMELKWSIVFSFFDKKHAVYDWIYLPFRLIAFLILEWISNFLIYRLFSCNVSFHNHSNLTLGYYGSQVAVFALLHSRKQRYKCGLR